MTPIERQLLALHRCEDLRSDIALCLEGAGERPPVSNLVERGNRLLAEAPDACSTRWARVAAWHVSELDRAASGVFGDDVHICKERLAEDSEGLAQAIEDSTCEARRAKQTRYTQWLNDSFEQGGRGAYRYIRESAAWTPPNVKAGDGSALIMPTDVVQGIADEWGKEWREGGSGDAEEACVGTILDAGNGPSLPRLTPMRATAGE